MSFNKSIKRIIDDAEHSNSSDVDICDRAISDITEYISPLSRIQNLTRLTLSHNKLSNLPSTISEVKGLESLNLFNNHLETLPLSINDLQKLKHLNVAVNRLNELPRGFGACPQLQVLDITYNNLTELPNNFHYLCNTLRALYLGDNDFKIVPTEVTRLNNLQILSLRDNHFTELPAAIGQMIKLTELLIQNNFLNTLPVELTQTDLANPKNVFKAEGNPFQTELQKYYDQGIAQTFQFLKSPEYAKILEDTSPVDQSNATKDKTLKKSRKGQKK